MVFVRRQTESLQESEGVRSAVSYREKVGEVAENGSSNDQLNLRTELPSELEINMQWTLNTEYIYHLSYSSSLLRSSRLCYSHDSTCSAYPLVLLPGRLCWCRPARKRNIWGFVSHHPGIQSARWLIISFVAWNVPFSSWHYSLI